MKKKRQKKNRFSWAAYLISLLDIMALLAGSSILSYFITEQSDSTLVLVIAMVIYVLVASAIFTLVEFYQRNYLVRKPANQILDATDNLINGNYDIDLKVMDYLNPDDAFYLIAENINQLAKELKSTEMVNNDFISNVSHEIKTPIAIIQNYAKALKKPGLSDDEKEKYLTAILDASKRLNSLVTNMLQLNKLEHQGGKLEIKEVNLYDSLSESIMSYDELLTEKNIELVCDMEEIKISSNPDYLVLVWNNLISNAIKFTPSGGTITISLHMDDEQAIIKVKDTGCGISTETGKHIFDKFYQGDTSHSGEGNGLGLALVKKIIDLVEGELSVESKIGEGSTFTVKLSNIKHE